ncbi:MAG: DUF4276 family protein [Candidatus Thiodiazotropha sp. (ex Rostrolucina anterorostrata)]|nr:DUF4276 family protein [Candidatus Thiodiazotropha sp. (ex Rostrolucina anterorostrata)]
MKDQNAKIRLLILVESPTERFFITHILAPILAPLDINICATTLGSPRIQGGIQSWKTVFKRSCLRATQKIVLDYYGLPSGWPGKKANGLSQNSIQKAESVENPMLKDLSEKWAIDLISNVSSPMYRCMN